ncbi:hypothetical protein KUCAC02_004858, partial [Chaenocephalus aceratus]
DTTHHSDSANTANCKGNSIPDLDLRKMTRCSVITMHVLVYVQTEVYGGPHSTRPKSTGTRSPEDRSLRGPAVHKTEVYRDPQSTRPKSTGTR